jgi:cyanophycin synthetase
VPGRRALLTLAARADLVRSTGLRHATRRLRYPAAFEILSRSRRTFYERLWREAAAEVGAGVRDLGEGFLELSRDQRRTRVWQQWVELDDAVTLRLALDKAIVTRLLAEAGLPVPEQLELSLGELDRGARFLGGGACVVKPASGTGGGESTTVGIRTPGELRRAALRAARSDSRLLLERQAPGDVYRLLFLDGALLDVVRRLPPRLVGDGHSTIDELIAAENARRVAAAGEAGLDLLTVDLDCVLTLRLAGLSLRTVTPAGQAVVVKTVTNQNRVEDNETLREGLCDQVVADARRAAEAVGLRLAGVDVVTPDPARPLRDAGGTIIEVNGTPGLHHHYHVADAASATPVAVPILRAALS